MVSNLRQLISVFVLSAGLVAVIPAHASAPASQFYVVTRDKECASRGDSLATYAQLSHLQDSETKALLGALAAAAGKRPRGHDGSVIALAGAREELHSTCVAPPCASQWVATEIWCATQDGPFVPYCATTFFTGFEPLPLENGLSYLQRYGAGFVCYGTHSN